MVFGNCIRRVRRDGRDNQGVAFPSTDEFFHIGHPLFIRLVVGDWEIDQRFAEHAPHARFKGLVSDRIFKVIHIAVGGGAAPNHFCQTQARAHAHEFFVYVFGFGRKNVFSKPLL